MYAQLVALLDYYEGFKKESVKPDNYVYYAGACDALKRLKEKMERYEAERT